MAYDEMFFAHAPCGFAVMIGKTQIGEWSFIGERMAAFTSFLTNVDDYAIRTTYFETQVHTESSEKVESFLILTGTTFGEIWTTPSGTLFNWRDYVDPQASFPDAQEARGAEPMFGIPDVDLRGIFRIKLLAPPRIRLLA